MSNTEIWLRSGAAIATHHESTGLSLRAFGSDLGVSHETVRQWMLGAPIDPRHLWTVAEICGFDQQLRCELVANMVDLDLVELLDFMGLRPPPEAGEAPSWASAVG